MPASDVPIVEQFAKRLENFRSFAGAGGLLQVRGRQSEASEIQVRQVLVSEADAVVFEQARDNLLRDIAAATNRTFVQVARSGINPQFGSDTIGEALTATRGLLAAWQALPIAAARQEGSGFPFGLILLAGAGLVGVAWLAKRKTLEGIGDSDPSRALKVGILGGASGLLGLAGQSLVGSNFLGPIVGGAVGALAYNAMGPGDHFAPDTAPLALVGTVAGLSGSFLAERLVASVPLSQTTTILGRSLAGSIFGGAAAALASDRLVPSEYQLKERSDATSHSG